MIAPSSAEDLSRMLALGSAFASQRLLSSARNRLDGADGTSKRSSIRPIEIDFGGERLRGADPSGQVNLVSSVGCRKRTA